MHYMDKDTVNVSGSTPKGSGSAVGHPCEQTKKLSSEQRMHLVRW